MKTDRSNADKPRLSSRLKAREHRRRYSFLQAERAFERLELRWLLAADVWTDQADYAFESTAQIGGSGFASGETIELQVLHVEGTPGSNLDPQNQPWQIQADGNGDLRTTWLVDDPDAVNASYVLTAKGLASGEIAQAHFTDSLTLQDATLNGGSSVSVVSNAPITVSVTNRSTANSDWRSTGWAIGTSLPGTYTIVNHADHLANGMSTESFSISAPTASGTYNAYFVAFSDDAGATGASAVFTLVGAVTVSNAPVLTPAAPDLVSIAEDTTNPAGQSVGSFSDAAISDADSGALEGIAVTGLAGTTNGVWQYNLGGGWVNVGAVSTSSALLLRSSDLIRFVPNANFNGTAALTYFAWDQTGATAGQEGTLVDPGSPRGGATPFSIFADTAILNITEVNDSPTVVADSQSAAEDTPASFPTTGLLDNDLRGPANESAQTLTVIGVDPISLLGGTVQWILGQFIYTPPANFSGADSFHYTVMDNGLTNGVTDPQIASGTVSVSVIAVNDPPTLSNVPASATISELQAFSFTASASDIDSPAAALVFSLVGAPAGATINPATGVFAWTPSEVQGPGTYTFNVRVSDGSLDAIQPIELIVVEANIAPVLNDVPSTLSVTELQTVHFTATATDADIRFGSTVTSINPLSLDTPTEIDPQSKVWQHGGSWWAALATPPQSGTTVGIPPGTVGGTWLWRLDGSNWTPVLRLASNSNFRADVKVVGDVTHILLDSSTSTRLVSVQYVPGSPGTYQFWSARPAIVTVSSGFASETATLEIDSTGTMWIAEDDVTDLYVRHSESPYTIWSAPLKIAQNIGSDDVGTIAALPNGTIGVMWSNQTAQRFGFRAHVDGTDPAVWLADEVPASQSALNVGHGMADDHLNIAVGSSGTVYAAVKTGYDTNGTPDMALLVRRPPTAPGQPGTWDDLYAVDETDGTRPIVQISESRGMLRYIYAGASGYSDIVYKDTPLSAIDFSGPRQTLMGGGNWKEVSGSKSSLDGELLVIATNTNLAAGGARVVFSPPVQLLSFSLVGAPAGAAIDPQTGHFSWTPSAAQGPGVYTFSVMVSDGEATVSKTVEIMVTDPNIAASVVGRQVFYNNSKFDGGNSAPGASDDAAIASDKAPLLPGGTATSANYTSYTRGINGVFIDIAGLPSTPTISDFSLRLGNDNSPDAWTSAPVPTSIIVRPGVGVGGSDRVALTWTDGAIQNTWLQVIVKPTAATGLATPDVFYYGNAIGESGDNPTHALVNSADELGARNHPQTFLDPALPTNPYDFNRDGFVNATDQILARSNATTLATSLRLISVPAAAQSAAAGVDANVAFGLIQSAQEPVRLSAAACRELTLPSRSAALAKRETDELQLPSWISPSAPGHSASLGQQPVDADEDLFEILATDLIENRFLRRRASRA